MHYKKTYLKQVILRLDFGRLAILSTDKETPFTKDMKDRYPEVSASPASQLTVSLALGGISVGQQGLGYIRVHKAKDTNRSVSLAPDFVSIEYGADAYDYFDELRGQVAFVLASFRTHFGTVPFTRIGLRYVNEITLTEGSALDWDGLINANLVSSVKAGMQNGLRMTRSVHQLSAIKDDIAVTLTYGITNPDFPNPVARRQFVLDLDCSVNSLVESAEAEARIKEANALAESVYESSIEDGLRNKMEIMT